MQVGAPDVRACLADGFHDVCVQTTPILAGYRQPHSKRFAGRLLPVNVYPSPVCRQRKQVRAVSPVDGYATTLGHVADDRVARHGLATLRIPNHQTVDTLDLDATSEANAIDYPPEYRGFRLLELITREVGVERTHDLADGHVAPPYGDL